MENKNDNLLTIIKYGICLMSLEIISLLIIGNPNKVVEDHEYLVSELIILFLAIASSMIMLLIIVRSIRSRPYGLLYLFSFFIIYYLLIENIPTSGGIAIAIFLNAISNPIAAIFVIISLIIAINMAMKIDVNMEGLIA